MQQESPTHIREHFFYVSIAKHLFQHPRHGIVSVVDPIRVKEASMYGLSPLILYGLSVPGTSVHWLAFSTCEKPLSFMQVLQDAWLTGSGLRGQPDILRINKHVAQSCPGLSAQLARIGVEVRQTELGDKSHPAALRTAQNEANWLFETNRILDSHGLGGPVPDDAVLALCRAAFQTHEWKSRFPGVGTERRDLMYRNAEWLALPRNRVVPSSDPLLDWAQGPWLTVWESALPPEQPRFLTTSRHNGQHLLLTGYPDPEEDEEDDDGYESYIEYDNTPELVKNLIDCWPSSLLEIAKHISVTQRALTWYTGDKGELDSVPRYHLRSLFDLEFDDFERRYQARGPYVLVARKPKAIEFVYEEITQGGDAQPFEIVPTKGDADPSWRYLVVVSRDDAVAIVMVARGTALADRLGKLFLNYKGVKSVDPKLYRDVVSTCARASQSPEANMREMREFRRRYWEREHS